MKNRNNIIAISATLLALAAGCTYEFPESIKPTSGDADFSKVVVIGSSMTAGFMNGALYDAGQQNSFVSIIANQMTSLDGGSFNQPNINAVNGCYNPAACGAAGRLYLKGVTSPAPTPKVPGDAITAYTGDKSALNNFSAYGISIQLSLAAATSGPASSNPYYNPFFSRFALNPSVDGVTGSSIISDASAALANGGAFFIFWLGNDDVLGYATNGADQADVSKPLTSVGNFTTYYGLALNAILNANTETKGIVANIPDVTALPYFSTVAYNPVKLSSQTQADDLNTGYAAYNAGINAAFGGGAITAEERDRRLISFTWKNGAGQVVSNELVIVDETLTDLSGMGLPSYRESTATDLITLSAGAIIPTGGGTATPLADKYVLLPSEKTDVQDRITAFNNVIASAVSANSDRLELVNVYSILGSLKANGAIINGSALTASISPPFGGFSLDGVHPNARGNAYVANKFIETINYKFGSTIPYCNPNSFAGNELPVP